MDFFNLLQWPATALTMAASWCVASSDERRRNWGFWLFLISNVLWVAWGLHDKAYALVAMQFGLAALNIRGATKTKN